MFTLTNVASPAGGDDGKQQTKNYTLILYLNKCQEKQFVFVWNCVNQQRAAAAAAAILMLQYSKNRGLPLSVQRSS
jgi:hypothetical protein